MTVTKCDICKSERSVTAMFITIRGEYDNKHVDAEASIDLCDDCKRKFITPVENNDTHVRMAKK